jgi:putative membrane protein
MLIKEGLLAYAHFMAAFGLVAALIAELAVFRQTMPLAQFHRLGMIDRWYGTASLLVILTGLARLHWGIQGEAFITHNPVFWTKMSLYVLVGILSITPTVLFIRWKSRKPTDDPIVIDASDYSRVRMLLWLQAVLFIFIPLCAALMTVGV